MAQGDTNLTNVVASGTLAVTGATTLTGALTCTVPLTTANINGGVARKVEVVHVGPSTPLADSTTYTRMVAFGRACTVKQIKIGATVKPVGGTNTVAIKKNGSSGNTLLNAATFDPTTITANDTMQALTLTATAADLALAANDTIFIQWVAGVQTTDCQGPCITIEVEFTDF